MGKKNNLPAVVEEEEEYQLFREITSAKRRKFLIAFCKTGGIHLSMQLSGVDWRNHYNWLRDPVYAEAFERAKQIACDHMESEVARRPFHGSDKPIIWKGKITGFYKEFSDILAMFMLNGNRPEKFHRKPDDVGASSPTTINIIEYVDKRTINVESNPIVEAVEQEEKKDAAAKAEQPIIRIAGWAID